MQIRIAKHSMQHNEQRETESDSKAIPMQCEAMQHTQNAHYAARTQNGDKVCKLNSK